MKTFAQFSEIPLYAIEPDGWLQRQVALQHDGPGQMLSSTTEGRLEWVRY